MQFMYFKVCKMSVKEQFIENAKDGKVLTHKCTSCGFLHLSTVYYCEKCGSKGFEDAIFDLRPEQLSVRDFIYITDLIDKNI